MQSLIERTYVAEQLKLRKAEYSVEDCLMVYVLTYNAAGKKPKSGAEIAESFFTGELRAGEGTERDWPDIYAICIQEVCPLNTKSVIAKSDNAQVWEYFLLKSLNSFSFKSSVEYTKLASKDMVGLFTVVFIRKDKAALYTRINSATSEVAVGMFGMVVSGGSDL